jgi:hypothetical protein
MNGETYWRQRYEMLMANFGDMVRAATEKQPVLLAEKESYELGKLHGEISEREACAKLRDELAERFLKIKDFKGSQIAASLSFDIRARGQA